MAIISLCFVEWEVPAAQYPVLTSQWVIPKNLSELDMSIINMYERTEQRSDCGFSLCLFVVGSL